MTMDSLTHIDTKGNAVMVDISGKSETAREALAGGRIFMNREALTAITADSVPKGDVFAAARIAGILAAKRTHELIPLCHPLMLSQIAVDFQVNDAEGFVSCTCLVKLNGKTGAEMEALTGVSTALLTIYDMCKALDKAMMISDIRLLEKSGGKSGHYIRKGEENEIFNIMQE